jgi:hypothetical protein
MKVSKFNNFKIQNFSTTIIYFENYKEYKPLYKYYKKIKAMSLWSENIFINQF